MKLYLKSYTPFRSQLYFVGPEKIKILTRVGLRKQLIVS